VDDDNHKFVQETHSKALNTLHDFCENENELEDKNRNH